MLKAISIVTLIFALLLAGGTTEAIFCQGSLDPKCHPDPSYGVLLAMGTGTYFLIVGFLVCAWLISSVVRSIVGASKP